jgi:opacity protein-like surface antigen
MGRLQVLLVTAVALILAAQAAGAAPTVAIEEVDRTRTLSAGTFCDFDVVLHSEGTRRTTAYTDQNGNFDRLTIHLSHWKTSFTNSENGATIRTVLAGPVIVEAQDDGTAIVRIPGNDGLLVAKGEGPLYTDQGLIVYLAPDAVNWEERIEVLHVAGGYRSPDDFGTFVAAVCGAIG